MLESPALPFLIPDGELASLEDAALAEDALVERARIAALMPDLLDPVKEEGEEEEEDSEDDDDEKKHESRRTSRAPSRRGLWRSCGRARCWRARYAAGAARARARDRSLHRPGEPRGGGRAERRLPVRGRGDVVVADAGRAAAERERRDAVRARRDEAAAAGEEITLAYTRGEGTSRAHFAQYGFVPFGGYAGTGSSSWARGGSSDAPPAAVKGKTATRLRASLRAALRGALQRCAAKPRLERELHLGRRGRVSVGAVRHRRRAHERREGENATRTAIPRASRRNRARVAHQPRGGPSRSRRTSRRASRRGGGGLETLRRRSCWRRGACACWD